MFPLLLSEYISRVLSISFLHFIDFYFVVSKEMSTTRD